MSFDLLANPFAVLGLTGDANIGSVTARSRDIGSAEASGASRTLLSPRTRLSAELSFLPGASESQVDGCLKALRDGAAPDLWSLIPLARANLLAHLASSGKATAGQLRDLAGMQDAIAASAPEAVNRAREAAKMPLVSYDMLNAALEALGGQHAEALCDGAVALQNGAEFLAELLRSYGSKITPRVMFLRQVVASWERAAASEAARELEAAEILEAKLRAEADQKAAASLGELVLSFALRTKPPREAGRLFGLPHEPSVEAARRWRAVALDLNNRQDAVTEAVTIFEALAAAFGTEDEIGIQVASDLKVCRDRLASGEGTPEMRRLAKAVAVANASPMVFNDCGMLDGETTFKTPPLIVELHTAFVVATGTARSAAPWLLLRTLTLRLHNEFSATTAAWSLTCLALRQTVGNASAGSVRSLLESDRRVLRAQIVKRDLDVAVRKKQKGIIRNALTELVTLTDDYAERREYENALLKLRSQARASTLRWGFCAASAVVVIIMSQSGTRTPVSYPGSYSPGAFSPSASQADATAYLDRSDTTPRPYSSPAAPVYPASRPYAPPSDAPTPGYTPAAAYQAPSPPIAPSSYSPAPMSPASTPMSQPYSDGQADRRAWEAWIGGLSGSAHDGAEWWASVRSSARRPACNAAPMGLDQVATVAACNQAKTRLAPADKRRHAEPEYRAGWNNP